MADGLHYDGGGDSGGDEGAGDDYKSLASEAFPDEDWTSERVAALKALIKLCMGDSGGEPDADDEPDEKTKGLALIFGGPKKK